MEQEPIRIRFRPGGRRSVPRRQRFHHAPDAESRAAMPARALIMELRSCRGAHLVGAPLAVRFMSLRCALFQALNLAEAPPPLPLHGRSGIWTRACVRLSVRVPYGGRRMTRPPLPRRPAGCPPGSIWSVSVVPFLFSSLLPAPAHGPGVHLFVFPTR